MWIVQLMMDCLIIDGWRWWFSLSSNGESFKSENSEFEYFMIVTLLLFAQNFLTKNLHEHLTKINLKLQRQRNNLKGIKFSVWNPEAVWIHFVNKIDVFRGKLNLNIKIKSILHFNMKHKPLKKVDPLLEQHKHLLVEKLIFFCWNFRIKLGKCSSNVCCAWFLAVPRIFIKFLNFMQTWKNWKWGFIFQCVVIQKSLRTTEYLTLDSWIFI